MEHHCLLHICFLLLLSADCIFLTAQVTIPFAEGHLFVCDYNKLLQFTPEGKFVRQIGKAGQGPGEYNQSIVKLNDKAYA